MVIFLHGSDTYRQQERLDFLREAFKAKYDEPGHNVSSIDGEQFDLDEFRKQTKSGGLFSQKRFIVLRNVWGLPKEQQEQLQEELTSVDADTILCILGATPPRKNNTLYKKLLRADTVEEFAELNAAQLRTFIQQECGKHEATIDSAAVEHLAESIGNDLWRMTSEVKRLANYTTHITNETVTDLIDEVIDDNIFNLTDALGAKDARRASTLLAEQFAGGANEQYLVTMLGRHIGTLLKVKQTKGQGLKMHPYVLEKARAQCTHFSVKELLQLYWGLLTIDHELKTTDKSPLALLDLFVLQACAV